MKLPKIRQDSLSILLARRIGFWNGGRVLVFIIAWGIFTEKHDRPPESVEEYSDYFGQSERSTYRELALFRKGLPGEPDPTRIWELIRAQVPADDEEGPAVLGAVSPGGLRIAGL